MAKESDLALGLELPQPGYHIRCVPATRPRYNKRVTPTERQRKLGKRLEYVGEVLSRLNGPDGENVAAVDEAHRAQGCFSLDSGAAMKDGGNAQVRSVNAPFGNPERSHDLIADKIRIDEDPRRTVDRFRQSALEPAHPIHGMRLRIT